MKYVPPGVAESWENGKPVRETLNADIPLVVDHFRYFAAAAARAEEGRSTEIEKDLVAYRSTTTRSTTTEWSTP
jgi:acyl-CoA reductase-like NAD-dependent aldehyde dehydrogenase